MEPRWYWTVSAVAEVQRLLHQRSCPEGEGEGGACDSLQLYLLMSTE